MNKVRSPTMSRSQRFSVRATSVAGTIPSGNGCSREGVGASANGASRKEQEEIESEPSGEQEQNRDARHEESATRTMPERLGGGGGADRRRDMRGRAGSRIVAVEGFGHRSPIAPGPRPGRDRGPAGNTRQRPRSAGRRAAWR